MKTLDLIEHIIKDEDFENTVNVCEFYITAEFHVSASYLHDSFLKSIQELGNPFVFNMKHVRFTRLD